MDSTTKARSREKQRAIYEKYGLVATKEERDSLVALLRSKQRLEFMNSIGESSFADDLNQLMFLAIQRQMGRSKPIDPVGLAAESILIAKERGMTLRLSPGDFGSLVKSPEPSDLEEVARRLSAAEMSRQMVDFATWIMEQVQNYVDPFELAAQGQERLSAFKKPETDNRVHYGEDLASDIVKNLKARKAARAAGKVLHIDWPWDSWNRQVGIHVPGKLFLFAMPDGHGKSTYGVQIGEHLAQRGLDTFIVALEDPIDSIHARMAAKHAGIPFARYITGEVTDQEEANMEAALNKKLNKKLHFLTFPGASAYEVLRELDILRLSGRVPNVVIVDYAEALEPSEFSLKRNGGNPYEAQGADMMSMVHYSSRHDVPFIVFDQMRKEYASMTTAEKAKAGRSLIAGSVGKSRASQTIVLGENTGPTPGSDPMMANIGLVVDKANNSTPHRHMKQILHGPTYSIIDAL